MSHWTRVRYSCLDHPADCGKKTEAAVVVQKKWAQDTLEGSCESISHGPVKTKGQRWYMGSYLFTSQESHVGGQGFPGGVSEEWGKARLCAKGCATSRATGGFILLS